MEWYERQEALRTRYRLDLHYVYCRAVAAQLQQLGIDNKLESGWKNVMLDGQPVEVGCSD